MHTTHALLLPALALITSTLAAPQSSLNDLPACAQQAGLAAISATGCTFSDVACICASVPFITTLRTYIEEHCTVSDQVAALAFGQSTCAPYGVTFSASVPGAPATTALAATDVALAVGGTVTSTIAATTATDAAAVAITASWTDYPSSAPTGNATAALLPYTGGAASGGFVYEVAIVLAGAVGVAAFLV